MCTSKYACENYLFKGVINKRQRMFFTGKVKTLAFLLIKLNSDACM